jgi:hypothetical protein
MSETWVATCDGCAVSRTVHAVEDGNCYLCNDCLDDRVSEWHDLGVTKVSLHDYLGMTWDQYARWVEHPALQLVTEHCPVGRVGVARFVRPGSGARVPGEKRDGGHSMSANLGNHFDGVEVHWVDVTGDRMSRHIVWSVWTEDGEYEQWSRDLRGVFATAELAEAHAAQLRESREYDVCEVLEESVLQEIPSRVPFIEWSAHITPDGAEDRGLGFDRGEKFKTWSNEIEPATGRVEPWNARQQPGHMYIEVVGSDPEAVAAEYARLLTEVRAGSAASDSKVGGSK